MLRKLPPNRRTPKKIICRKQESLSQKAEILATLEALPSLNLIIDKNRQIIFANSSSKSLVPDNGVDKPIDGARLGELLQCVQVHDGKAQCGTTEACRTCGAFAAMLESIEDAAPAAEECRIRRLRDGQEEALDYHVSVAPLSGVANEDFYLVSLRDISAEKRRDIFERSFLHDIINTTGGIRGFLEILQENGEEEEQEALLGDVLGATDFLIDELESYQALVRAESNQISLELELIESVSVLQAVKRRLEVIDRAAGKTLILSGKAERVKLFSDRVLLGRILTNMVKNAIEATASGAVITLSSEARDSGALFSVNNPGVMPVEVQQQVFQRSYSTKGSGRGLGTYSMKLFGERYLKGKVSFKSDSEKGTTFSLWLPLMIDD